MILFFAQLPAELTPSPLLALTGRQARFFYHSQSNHPLNNTGQRPPKPDQPSRSRPRRYRRSYPPDAGTPGLAPGEILRPVTFPGAPHPLLRDFFQVGVKTEYHQNVTPPNKVSPLKELTSSWTFRVCGPDK